MSSQSGVPVGAQSIACAIFKAMAFVSAVAMGAPVGAECVEPARAIVSWVSPSADAVLGVAPQNVTLVANGSGAPEMLGVAFYNGATFLGNGTRGSGSDYSFTWTGVGSGTYTITARATARSAGCPNHVASANRSFTVQAANQPPSVALTQPANGTVYQGSPANIALSATASDSGGSVNKVEFLSGSSVIATVTSAPYQYTWSGVGSGSYSISARATDNVGATTTSSAATVNVNAQPAVSLSGPSNGAVFNGPVASIPITANASDSDGAISRVEFIADGTVIGTDTTAPYAFTWANVGAGTYSIAARATDSQGGVTTSGAVSVRVNALPNVSVSSNAATGMAPASFTLSATASDSDGSISRVEFLANGSVVGTDTSAPFSFAWSGVGDGTYTVTARATDNNGQRTTSSGITITVGPYMPATVPVNITPPNLSGAVAGTLAGTVQVTPKGSASYDVALALPPGTAGMAPNVGLAYDSQAGDGLLGRGWTITGLSTITRCGKTLATDNARKAVLLNTEDEFCIDGQRLVRISGTVHGTALYRTEVDHFTWVQSVAGSNVANGPDSWEVRTKDGLIHRYGTTADSRVEIPGSTVVLSWALSRREDRRGNYVDYLYDENPTTGDHSIRQIRYTGNHRASPTLAPYNAVNFVYETRPDTWRGWVRGGQLQRTKRLTHIRTLINTDNQGAGGTLVRELRVAYTTNATNGRSLVSSLTDCASDGSCLPATTFGWSARDPAANTLRGPGSGNWGGPSVALTNDFFYYGDKTQQVQSRVLPGDLNGDGRADLLYSSGDGVWHACFSQVTNSFACSAWTGPAAPSEKVVSGDFNGDGRSDIAVPPVWGNGSVDTWSICLSTGSGLTCSTASMNSFGQHAGRYQVADFDGDGRDDILVVNLDANESASLCRSTGASFSACTPFNTLISFIEDPEAPRPPYARVFRPLADFDGDGRADLLKYSTSDGVTGRFFVRRTTDTGFVSGSSEVAAITPYIGGIQGRNALVDSNGDPYDAYPDVHNGVDDWPNGTRSETCHYTGVNFVCTVQNHPTSDIGTVYDVKDFDGDGRPDSLNYGSKAVAQLMPDGSRGPRTAWESPLGSSWLQLAGDFNGDGVTDMAYYIEATGTWTVSLAGFGGYSDLLSRVTNGVGHVTEIQYKGLHDPAVYTVGTSVEYPKRNVASGPPVVSLLRTDNGVGGWLETAYRYAGLRSHSAGRGSLGFETVTQEDRTTNVTTVTTFSQDFPTAGMVSQARATHSSGVVLALISNGLASFNTVGQARHPYVSSTATDRNDLDGSPMQRVVNAIDSGGIDTVYGNVTARTETTSAAGETFTSRTTAQYLNDDVNVLWGLPTRVTIRNSAAGSADVIRTVSRAYVAGTTLLEREEVEPDDVTHRLTTTYAYDTAGYGVVTKKTLAWYDPATSTSRTRDVSILSPYDSRFRWPLTVTNAKGQSTHRTYADATGQLLSQTDPNGLTTTWTYDGWGSKLSEAGPDSTKTTWSHRQCVDTCANGATSVDVTQEWARVAGVDQRTSVPGEVFYDRLGRKVLTRTWSAAGEQTFSDRVFDARGRLERVSRVHTLSERNAGGQVWTYLASDDLGRPVRVDTVKASGSGFDTTNVEYRGLTTVRIRPWREGLNQRQTRTEVRNALGKLKSVTDEAGKATTYAYEPFGNLVRTTDPRGNQINVEYDRLGRKKKLQDPDLGTWLYQVNPLGLTWRLVDAKNQTATFRFDDLDRLEQRIEADATSTWVYDTAAYGVGRLAEAYTGPSTAKDYRRVHAFDSLGRERKVTISFAGEWDYATTVTYDSFGRAGRLDHSRNAVGGSGGPVVSFALSYNSRGSVRRVERIAGGTVEPLWSLTTQDAEGRIAEEDLLLSGQKTMRSFNRFTGRLETIRTGLGNGLGSLPVANIQDDIYVYDEVGNVRQRQQRGATGTFWETFTYDARDRMVTAQVGGQPQKVFSYDDIGNILAKADVGIYSYLPSGAGSVRPHAVSQITGTVAGITNPSFSYDANGNLLSGLGRSYGWNAANLPVRIDKLSGGAVVERTEFLYGPERQRTQQLVRPVSGGVAGSPTRIVRYAGAIEKEIDYAQNKTTVRTALPLSLGFYEQVVNDVANVATATPAQSQHRYFHSDLPGSLNVVTDSGGTVLQRMSYDAWGRRRNVDGGDDSWGTLGSPSLWNAYGDRGYTGHDQIDQLGLVHMIGRVYDPIVGRMTSADPTVPDASDVQAFNRYSYVLGNPLRYVDPTGFSNCTVVDQRVHCEVVGYREGNPLLRLPGQTTSVSNGIRSSFQSGPRPMPGGPLIFTPNQQQQDSLRRGLEWLVGEAESAGRGAKNMLEGYLKWAAENDSKVAKLMLVLMSEAHGDQGTQAENALGADGNGGSAQPPDPDDDDPSWSKARSDHWKNKADKAKPGEYSPENLARMKDGKAPLHDELGVSKELHHKVPQREGGSHKPSNLQEVWPWEHAKIDPYRHYNGPKPPGF